MSWMLFAILSPALYCVASFVDKYLLARVVTDYRGMPIYGAIMGLVFGTLFWAGSGFPLLAARDAALIILTGVLSVWGGVLYFKALSEEEASRIVVLIQTMPLLVLILSVIFLREVISPLQLAGFFLILLSAIGISVDHRSGFLRLSPAFYLQLLANLAWAVSAVLLKFVMATNSFFEVVSYESWGYALGGLTLWVAFPAIRQSFLDSLKTAGVKAVSIVFLNEGVAVIAKLLGVLAISLGPVALVSVVGSTQVFFGILYGWVLTLLFPAIFKEDIQAANLFKKAMLAVVMFAGIWLVR
jgi:drug/metabolite transporter (DMT)-like permease